MAQQYHSTTQYPVTGAITGIDDSHLIDRLNDIIASLETSTSVFSETDLIGSSTLLDGGLLGNMINLVRVHINTMLDANELTESAAGEALSSLIAEAMKTSIGFIASQKESENRSLGIKADIIASIIKTSSDKVKLFTAIEESKITEFNIKYLLPKQVEELEEKIELTHLRHQKEKFDLDNIMPVDKDIKIKTREKLQNEVDVGDYNIANYLPIDKDIKLQQKEKLINEVDVGNYNIANYLSIDRDIKLQQKEKLINEVGIGDYELASMLPAKLSYQNAQTSLVTCQKNLSCKEVDIKTYYNSNIQPYEKDQAEAKAIIDKGSAGLIAGHTDNMGIVKTEQLIAQTALYTRQEEMYDEKKYMEIFKIQMNYQTLIYADLGPATVVPAAADASIKNVFNSMTPTAINVS